MGALAAPGYSLAASGVGTPGFRLSVAARRIRRLPTVRTRINARIEDAADTAGRVDLTANFSAIERR